MNKRRLRLYAWLLAVAGVITMSAAEGPGVGIATAFLVGAGILFLET
jgi:hypothetical protein